MKIITGDYVGLIKALTFNEAEATAIPSKKLKSAGKKSAETPQTPVYTIHGKVDKKGIFYLKFYFGKYFLCCEKRENWTRRCTLSLWLGLKSEQCLAVDGNSVRNSFLS